MGGEGSAPTPHDYFDAALGTCKALTLKLYAQRKEIPLTGVTVEVKHDASEELKGKYALHVKLTLKGVLTDAQREELHNVADKCPVHKLMTTAEVTIETHLSEGAFQPVTAYRPDKHWVMLEALIHCRASTMRAFTVIRPRAEGRRRPTNFAPPALGKMPQRRAIRIFRPHAANPLPCR